MVPINQLIERPWIWSGIGLEYYKLLFGKIYKYKYGREYRECGLDINPFEIYYVDPSDINKRTGRRYDLYSDFGRIQGGDWDVDVNKWRYEEHPDYVLDLYTADELEESTHFKSMSDHFCDGVRWEDTDLYQIVLDSISEGNTIYHGCESESDLINQLAHVDQLYDTIRKNGYKSQWELISNNHIITIGDYIRLHVNEVLVDVGRSGRYYFVEGRHRLTIAKLLDLQEIPVVFLVRHDDWVSKIKNGTIRSHPDESNVPS